MSMKISDAVVTELIRATTSPVFEINADRSKISLRYDNVKIELSQPPKVLFYFGELAVATMPLYGTFDFGDTITIDGLNGAIELRLGK